MNKKVLKVHPSDNVIVALQDLITNEKIKYQDETYVIKSDIPAKHKFASKDFTPGENIYMYGVIVGKTQKTIFRGEPITIDNVIHDTNRINQKKETYDWSGPNVEKWRNRTFMGYHRKDGKVGTSNEWIVAPLVFCENRNIEVIRESLLEQLGYGSLKSHAINIQALIHGYKNRLSKKQLHEIDLKKTKPDGLDKRLFPNVDGIKFLIHHLGCGGTRSDSKLLCELLAGYITNPNVAGATILSLGCQNAEQILLMDAIKRRDPGNTKPVFFLEQQKSISEEEFIADAIKTTFTGLVEANNCIRKPAPLNKLVVGLECGGSDGFSGISANPALGYTSDLLNTLGGATILSEFPELHGIEREIIRRCNNKHLANRFMDLMTSYAKRAEISGSGFEENPSPGNIKDGLVTDAMKSAGAAKKGGTSPIVDVLDYTEPVMENGLNLLCTPGNDVESTTALAASGANMIVFTTGLGTPTGNPIAPVVKVSSNTQLFHKMNDIIDVDAGPVIEGKATIKQIGEEIFEYIIKAASGEVRTKAQLLGQEDFIPWKRDISL